MAKTAALRAHHAHKSWLKRLAWLKHWRTVLDVTGAVIVSVAVVSVIAQFLYPADRTLPFATIGGLDIGFKSRDALLAQLADYAQKGEVTVKTPSRQWNAKWQTVGVSIDNQASAAAALSYEAWERAIPFSSVAKITQSRQMPLIALADPDRLDAFAAKIVQEDKLAARDATIKITDGQVVIDEAKNGYEFTAADVKKQIQSTAVSTQATLQLKPQQVPYVRSEQALQQVKAQAELTLKHTPTLTVAGKDFLPDRAHIGSWITFADNEQTKTMTMAINRDAIKTYLESINKEVATNPGTSTVTLLDGQEVGRTPAAAGRSVAVDASVDRITEALQGQNIKPAVALHLADVPPKVNYVRTYSQTSAGLQAVIQDWERETYGTFGVLVRELGGERRYAEWQPDRQFVTASTFKLFVYYALQQKIQAGQVTYGQMTDMGWTVEACVEEMIVRSTNPCSVSLLNLIGWQQAQDYVDAAGFASTRLNNQSGGHKMSTVRDETNYMLRLNAGTLMGEEATGRLLGYLKRQIWRAGIPSGVPRGVTVANKVGFYDGWVHDIAIVYAPKGTYILGVMSKGGSDPQFADLSRRVYNFFNK